MEEEDVFSLNSPLAIHTTPFWSFEVDFSLVWNVGLALHINKFKNKLTTQILPIILINFVLTSLQ